MDTWKGFWRRFLCAVVLLSIICGYCFSADEAEDDPEGKVIESVDVISHVSHGRSSILSRVRTEVGDVFNGKNAEKDAENIATKLPGVRRSYHSAEVVDGKVRVVFVVLGYQRIRSIVFLGNKKLKDGSLKKTVGFEIDGYLEKTKVRLSVSDLEEKYYKKGYAGVEIKLDEAGLDVGNIIYRVKEGPRTRVKQVSFTGNVDILSKSLARAVKTRKRKFIFWPAYYSKDVVSEDVTKLKEVYQKRGYLNVDVLPDERFSEDGRFAYIDFKITEGEKYLIDKIKIEGNEVFSDEVLLDEMRLKSGMVYSEEAGKFDEGKMVARYKERGYVDAFVVHDMSYRERGGVVDITFEVKEGERFRIGKISITGNEDVHDKVIRRLLDEEDFTPGEWYNAEIARGDGTGELEKTVQRIVMTESTIIQATGDAVSHRDAQVNIIESKTGSIMLGAGVASNSGLIGQVVYDQRNFDIFDRPESFKELISGKAFKGAGQRFRISLSPGIEQSSYSVSFTEPYLYNKPVSLDVVGSSFDRWQEAYDEGRTKGYIGLEKRYKNDWRRGVSFRVENVEVSDIDLDAPQEIKDDKGDNNLLGWRLYINKNTTDSRFKPTRGYNFDAGYEQVAGDHTFGVVRGTQRWYKTLHEDIVGRKTVLETKIRGSAIIGDAPVFEKFYAGGTGSIRGFEYRGVSTRGDSTGGGPIVKKDPIGSDWLITGNAEVAVPLTSEALSWLFFVDAGVIDTGGPRASIGTGIQILIPQWFGPVPMRFEFAIPFAKDDEDDTRVFSFSVGALF